LYKESEPIIQAANASAIISMAVIYLILLLLLVITSILSLRTGFSFPALIYDIAFFIAIAYAFLESLSKNNLRVYFWFQRIRIWWHSDLVTKWWFSARLDGDFDFDTLINLLGFLQDSGRFKFPVRLEYKNQREAQVEIDDTLTLKIAVNPQGVFDDTKGHISILSKTLEVSYGHAKRKIDLQIIPVLSAIRDFLNPESSSYELNVDFNHKNPFFAIYIAHLKPEQVGDFRVLLYLNAYSQSPRAEKAEISKDSVHITSQSTDSLKQLALDFILLSPDLTMLTGARQDG
jgi:hypothetical protein